MVQITIVIMLFFVFKSVQKIPTFMCSSQLYTRIYINDNDQ